MREALEKELVRLEEMLIQVRQQYQSAGNDMLRIEGAIVTLRALLAGAEDVRHEETTATLYDGGVEASEVIDGGLE